MIDCITVHGEWRTKNKRGRLVRSIGKTGYTFHNVLCINDRYWVYCGDIKFYYPDGTYSGIRLKSLKQLTF